MTALVFVDTNVLVCAVDGSERAKQPVAREWIERLWRTKRGRVSVQVLQEYYVTVTRKLSPGSDRGRARAQVRRLLTWEPLAPDAKTFDAAWKLEDRFGISWWDALIVAAAKAQGCDHLLSEDLSDRMEYDGVTVVDPFATRPAELLGDERSDDS